MKPAALVADGVGDFVTLPRTLAVIVGKRLGQALSHGISENRASITVGSGQWPVVESEGAIS
jgi:hypothetical protein